MPVAIMATAAHSTKNIPTSTSAADRGQEIALNVADFKFLSKYSERRKHTITPIKYNVSIRFP